MINLITFPILQALLHAALESGACSAVADPINASVLCQALTQQADVARLVGVLAAVLATPSLPAALASALCHPRLRIQESWTSLLEVTLLPH